MSLKDISTFEILFTFSIYLIPFPKYYPLFFCHFFLYILVAGMAIRAPEQPIRLIATSLRASLPKRIQMVQKVKIFEFVH